MYFVGRKTWHPLCSATLSLVRGFWIASFIFSKPTSSASTWMRCLTFIVPPLNSIPISFRYPLTNSLSFLSSVRILLTLRRVPAHPLHRVNIFRFCCSARQRFRAARVSITSWLTGSRGSPQQLNSGISTNSTPSFSRTFLAEIS